METSRAIVITEKDHLELRELEKPKLKAYEVLFQTKTVSLCTIEQRTYKGTRAYQLPFLGGHECSGVVAEVGEGVVGVKVGDKVIFTSGYCNQCEFDRSGRGTQCENKQKMPKHAIFEGFVQGGGLSEYLAIPAWQIIKMPDDVNLNHAALTEPLACCVHSVSKARIKFADTVVIIGLGIMGFLHMKLALMRGARVVISETDETRKALALKNGAHLVFDPTKVDVLEEVRNITGGKGADVVFNTIANPSIWPTAIDLLAPYGRLIAYSSQDRKELIGVDFGYMHSKEIEFIGTLNPTIEDNEIATKLIGNNLIDMSDLIDSTYAYTQAQEAFDRACVPNTYRVLINF